MVILGKGRNGTAKLLENNNVLKVTQSEGEFEVAKFVMKNKPNWHCHIFSAKKVGAYYHIEKEFVNPIFPKASKKKDSDERFEFCGIQHFFGKKELVISIAQKISATPIIVERENRATLDIAISPYNMCRPKEWGSNFNVLEFNPKAFSKLVYTNGLERKIYEWFVPAFFQAAKANIFTGDLYQNIGIDKEGKLVFFDCM